MKIVDFDVGNASCNYICSPNKYAMMIDCGSSNDRKNPVDYILDWNKNIGGSLRAKPYRTLLGKEYPLTLLHITHPDEDHVRNSERISRDLPPYLMRHTYSEKFDDADAIIDSYKDKLDAVYRGHNPESARIQQLVCHYLRISNFYQVSLDLFYNIISKSVRYRKNGLSFEIICPSEPPFRFFFAETDG